MNVDLEALKQAALEATPGPYRAVTDVSHFDSCSTVIGGEKTTKWPHYELIVEVGGAQLVKRQEATTRFIAAANPSVVLELIRRLEVAEKQRGMLAVAAEAAAKELERDGDEWGVASDLLGAIASVSRTDNSKSARLVNCPTCFTAFPVSLDVNPLDVVTVEQPKEGGAE